jgi:hypothetical protein
MTRVAIPSLIVMLVVAGFIGVAAWNASTDPLLVITLTERELPLPARWESSEDESPLQLRIAYEGRYDPLDSRNWLPETRLREIGFSFHVPVGSPAAPQTYDHVPARHAWVVFEYDGPQWRETERRRALSDSEPRTARTLLQSRLVAVDAGPDFDRLRARYPSGHLILRGAIGLSYVSPGNGGPLVHGFIRELAPPHVAVPHAFRSLLDGMRPADPGQPAAPRYEIDIAIGRLGLPFVRSVRTKSRPVPSAKQLLRNRLQLHVRGAFVDLADLGVAKQFLNRVVADETVAAVQVHCHRGDAFGHFGRENLAHGGFVHEGIVGVTQSCGVVDH